MIALFLVAFTIGITGSLHCIGMCGPLVLALPFHAAGNTGRAASVSIYHTGRITSYALLGAIFGIIGKSIALFGYQQLLSLVLGILILFFLFIYNKKGSGISIPVADTFFAHVRKGFYQLTQKRSLTALFGMGMLNGLLPCGLVYMAVAGAIATGTVAGGTLFMASFGLGTLPLMWIVAYAGKQISISFRKNLQKVSPVVMSVMAVLLILRGLDLNIPFLSPHLEITAGKIHSCCTKP